jgi:hypothetical protein
MSDNWNGPDGNGKSSCLIAALIGLVLLIVGCIVLQNFTSFFITNFLFKI